MNLQKNKFYSVLRHSQEKNTLQFQLLFHADHEIFKGHFPQHPVVPGVCLMQIAKELYEDYAGKSMTITHAPQLKFLQLITPDIGEVSLAFTLDEQDTATAVKAIYSNDSKVLARLDMLLRPIL